MAIAGLLVVTTLFLVLSHDHSAPREEEQHRRRGPAQAERGVGPRVADAWP